MKIIICLVFVFLSFNSYAGQWKAKYFSDGMRGTVIKELVIESTNNVYFDAPYDGGSKMELILRSKWTKLQNGQDINTLKPADVLLTIKPGQFNCILYEECSISVKFDDGKILRYRARTSSDGSSDVIFIRNGASFIKNVGAHKKLIIESGFYQGGNRQFYFDIEGYKEKLNQNM
ncbi:hypothetical protein NCP51_004257 [Salmonella enterica]|nr:hypothetical protein [Salmonella enterica]